MNNNESVEAVPGLGFAYSQEEYRRMQKNKENKVNFEIYKDFFDRISDVTKKGGYDMINDVYSQIYSALLSQTKAFDFEESVQLAFRLCPGNFTKDEIIDLTTKIINEALNNGYIEWFGSIDKYKSMFSQQKTSDISSSEMQ